MKRPDWLLSLTQHGSKPPWLLKFRSSDGFIIGTVSLAVFTDMFLYAVIVPVIPFALQQQGHVATNRGKFIAQSQVKTVPNEVEVQYWVSVLVAIYGAALLAFSPICGWLADHSSSRRSPLLVGLFTLLGSTILLNVASTVKIFIVGRILQGISAAVVWVVGLALLADTVPQDRLAQAMGYVSLGMTMGILVAPLLGGVVFDHAGYDAVFGMSYALIGIDIVMRLLLVEKKVAARWDPDAAGRVQVTADSQNQTDTAPVEMAISQEDMESPSAPAPHATDPDKGGTVLPEPSTTPLDQAYTVPASEPPRHRVRDRLPPFFSLLYSRRLLAALFGSIIQAALLTSFDSVLTIHAARIFNWTSTGAALLFLPLVIPTFLAPLAGMLSDRIGGRYPASLGFLVATIPLVCLRFVDTNTLSDKVLLCALLALTGLSLCFTFPPFMAEISGVVESKEKKMLANGHKGYGKGGAYAQAYALFNVAFAAGTMTGPLLAGFIVQEKGWGTMAWVMGLLSAITSVPTFFWLGGWVFGKS